MTADFESRCQALVVELGLGNADAIQSIEPLTGGVASDIGKVVLADKTICIKFALPKLKVAQDWRAPVHRNTAEYHWLRTAVQIAPNMAPKLYGRSKTQHGFAMEFLDGKDVYLWKNALLQGQQPRGEAARVADVLGQIHATSARSEFDRSPFQNRDDFDDLRIDPYLRFTATRHSQVAGQIMAVADAIYANDTVLVHGDVSPKNIMIRGDAPIILDAECATMGDPSFDVAFCLNHLVLKAFHLPQMRTALRAELVGFWATYAPHIHWQGPGDLDRDVATLLPMLMLARVDGKSPVEYLDATTANLVRTVALRLIATPPKTLDGVIDHIFQTFEG